MDPSKGADIAYDFSPIFRVSNDGRVIRLSGTDTVPPSIHPQTGVSSKDVIIIPAETNVSARLYLPNITNTSNEKLPLLIYFHGGAFCIESTYSHRYHTYLNSLVAEANVLVVSVEYRLAPEHPLPIAYDDSWAAIQWVFSHSKPGEGPEAWLRDYADFGRVFFGGDSAGANIAHHMAMRVGETNLVAIASRSSSTVKLVGVFLVHPYFWGEEPIGSEDMDPHKGLEGKIWLYICPSPTLGCDDPLINPVGVGAPSLSGLGCTAGRVLVCVAEKDGLRDRGWLYYETLNKTSGWGGEVEIMEAQGEGHVFHLRNPTCDNALIMMKRLASFLNKV